MFNNNTKAEIKILQNDIHSVKVKVNGGIFGGGLKDDVETLTERLSQQTKAYNLLSDRVKVLEEVVRESGLITDYTPDEVKIREDRTYDGWGGYTKKNVAYQINQVKTV